MSKLKLVYTLSFQENMSCPCLLCYFTSLKIKDCTELRKHIDDGALTHKYKEPEQNCPFHETWTHFKAQPQLCCCLKHECKNHDNPCVCVRCNILTRVRMIFYPKHYKRKTVCTGVVCTELLPVSTPCQHTSCCVSTIKTSAQITNIDT